MRTAEEILQAAYDTHGMTTMEGLSAAQRDAISAIETAALLAIEQAQAEAVEVSAKVADPPLVHRKGAPGLWRRRRAAIASEIRNLLPNKEEQ